MPGAKDIDRVKKLLQSTAELQFWEVFSNAEVQNFLYAADAKTAELLNDDVVEEVKDTTATTTNLEDLLGEDKDSVVPAKRQNRLFAYLYPNTARSQQEVSSMLGQAAIIDTAKVNKYLAMKEVRALLPTELRYAKFLWDAKPSGEI